MVKSLQILFFLVGLGNFAVAQSKSFVENQGQWEEDFDYKLSMGNATVFLDQSSLTVHLVDRSGVRHRHTSSAAKKEHATPSFTRHHAYRVSFVGASAEAVHSGASPLKTYHNYFTGNDPGKWRGRVPLYSEVSYKSLYPGIDIMYYFSAEGNLKYDLIVAPDADLSKVKLRYEGADELELSNGHLLVKTSVQNVLEAAPYAYQMKDGRKERVECSYNLQENELSFDIGKYDHDEVLIIDPKLIFSTYSGSTGNNFGFTATHSEDGGLYAGGIVFLAEGNYPITTGAFQIRNQGGNIDIGISKFSADGSSLLFSTFLGGDSDEMPYSLYETTDKSLVIMGTTGSANFPVTANAYSQVFKGGTRADFWVAPAEAQYKFGSDMFFAILDSSGSNLLSSTYFGGNQNEGFNGALNHNYGDEFRGEVIADENGNIYGVSSTRSSNLPVAPDSNAYMIDYSGGQDGFVCSFNSDLSSLRWCSYIGGPNNENALSVRKGLNNDVYVVGGTNSTNLNFGAGSYHAQGMGSYDGYIVRLSDTDGSFLNGTFNGTPARDVNYFVDVDFNGDVYVMGQTRGVYPHSNPGFFGSPGNSQFLEKFSANLATSHRSTTIGSGGNSKSNISPTAFMVDDCRNIYISGWGGQINEQAPFNQGNTYNLPVTANAYQEVTDSSDFYFMVLDETWEKLNYATFFGGSNNEHVDGGTSRFSKDGTIYQAVCGGCYDQGQFPTTSGAWERQNGAGESGCNLAALKMQFEANEVIAKVQPDLDSSCIPYTANLTNLSYNADTYTWKLPDGQVVQSDISAIDITEKGEHRYRLIARDTTCSFIDSTEVVFYGFEDSVYAGFVVDYDSCGNDFKVNLINNSDDADLFEWDFGDGKTSRLKSPTHRFIQPGTYEIKLFTRNSYCELIDSASAKVTFKKRISSEEVDINYTPCENSTEAFFSARGTGFQDYLWDFGNGIEKTGRSVSHEFKYPGTYVIHLSLKDTLCQRFMESEVNFTVLGSEYEPEMPNIFTPNGDGVNDYFGPPNDLPASSFSKFSLEVFNRWGTMLYSSANASEPWNGTCENREVAEGVYFYILNFTDECNNTREYKGYVHLSR